ncbi:MAG: dihydrolipoyl dehydrogenase [bacterium]|nr:dihydrolipoyl dehydrogenase [bacterium]
MKKLQKKYDLIVIGAGVGLRIANFFANQKKWKVALIEPGPLGGTCLNRGCVPSKLLIHPADVIRTIKSASKLGIDAEIKNIDFKKIIAHANDYVDGDATNIEKSVSNNENIDLYKEYAEFIDDKIIKVGANKITSEKIVISAGTRPSTPPIEGINDIDYLTSAEALRLTTLPKSMLIIGGGYIAVELGHFYGTLCTELTIIERAERLVSLEDIDISTLITEVFSDRYNVKIKTEVVRITKENNEYQITIRDLANDQEEILSAEQVLVATGRKPNTDILKMSNTNIKLNKFGYIETNNFLETNVAGIWALGDINGTAQFRHTANWEAKHIINFIQGNKDAKITYEAMPHAIFTSPQVAGVGLTEDAAKKAGIGYIIKKRPFNTVAMGKAMEENDGFVKFILSANQETILGCQIVGPEASILIHEVIVSMKASGGKVSAIKNTIHIHPALSEVVQWAL